MTCRAKVLTGKRGAIGRLPLRADLVERLAALWALSGNGKLLSDAEIAAEVGMTPEELERRLDDKQAVTNERTLLQVKRTAMAQGRATYLRKVAWAANCAMEQGRYETAIHAYQWLFEQMKRVE